MPRKRSLNSEQASTILADYTAGRATQHELARRYGVSQGTISQLVRGLAYKEAGPAAEPKRRGIVNRRLTMEQAREIRAGGITSWQGCIQIAGRYGCNATTVYRIQRGLSYRDE